MAKSYSDKSRCFPRESHHHVLPILSTASPKTVNLSPPPPNTLPPQCVQTQSVFLIQAKNSYLGKSIHPSSLYFTPISFQISPEDIWVSPTWPIFKLFPHSPPVNIWLAFVFRHLFPEHKIMGCCVRSSALSCMLSIVHYPTCPSSSHYRDILYPFGLIQVKGPTPRQPHLDAQHHGGRIRLPLSSQ